MMRRCSGWWRDWRWSSNRGEFTRPDNPLETLAYYLIENNKRAKKANDFP
jgi:hypothetical protein